MSQVLKLNAINGDGSPASEILECVIQHPETGQPLPSVVVTVRPMSPSDYRKIQGQHVKHKKNPATRAIEESVDFDAVVDEVLRRSILSWVGFVGADDEPLACTDLVKAALDGRIKVQIFSKIVGSEVVDTEVSDARFREPSLMGAVGR